MYSLYNSVNILSPIYCSTVAKTYSGLTGRVSLRTDLAMVDQRSWVHVLSVISRGCVWEIDVWVLPALRCVCGVCVGGVSLSVLRPYAAHCIKLVCMAVIGVWWWVCGSFKVTPEVFSWDQTSQVLPHWLNHHFSLILVLYTETLSC